MRTSIGDTFKELSSRPRRYNVGNLTFKAVTRFSRLFVTPGSVPALASSHAWLSAFERLRKRTPILEATLPYKDTSRVQRVVAKTDEELGEAGHLSVAEHFPRSEAPALEMVKTWELGRPNQNAGLDGRSDSRRR